MPRAQRTSVDPAAPEVPATPPAKAAKAAAPAKKDVAKPAAPAKAAKAPAAAAKAAPAKAAKAPAAAAKAAPAKATRAPATRPAASKAPATKGGPPLASAPKSTTRAAAQRGATSSAPASSDAEPAPVSGGGDLDPFLTEQRALLLEERSNYTRQATNLRAEAEQLAEDREPGDVQFDEESGQGDTMNVERERDLALSAAAMQSVQEIDRALAKIDAGTYGICEKCGEPIPHERLAALPYASLCVKCKSGGLSRR